MQTNKQTRNVPTRDVDAEVGRRVHMLMWDKQLTQTSFGTQLGMDQSSLAKKLRGQRGWALAEVVAVATALDVTVGYLFGEEDGVGPTGIEPMTSTVKTGHSAEVWSITGERVA